MANVQKDRGFTQVANDLLMAAGVSYLAPNDMVVLVYVLIASYSAIKQPTVELRPKEFEDMFGIDETVASRAIKRLTQAGILERVAKCEYRLVKDYDRWRPPSPAIPRSGEKPGTPSRPPGKAPIPADRRRGIAVVRERFRSKKASPETTDILAPAPSSGLALAPTGIDDSANENWRQRQPGLSPAPISQAGFPGGRGEAVPRARTRNSESEEEKEEGGEKTSPPHFSHLPPEKAPDPVMSETIELLRLNKMLGLADLLARSAAAHTLSPPEGWRWYVAVNRATDPESHLTADQRTAFNFLKGIAEKATQEEYDRLRKRGGAASTSAERLAGLKTMLASRPRPDGATA